jgi:23S rRNA (guanine2445-N2)-methyltransferase / 23S rRNA (guanine2069-N7)-methyltransferase
MAAPMGFAARRVFFVTCVPGLEPVLHGEAQTLGLARLERQVGGIYFEGTLEDAWHANRGLRCALRVLLRLARFPARDADELYSGVLELPWEEYLRPEGTLSVSAQCRESRLDHTLFVEQRVKDAVVDRFRQRTGTRPSVERERPELAIHAHLFRDRATISLDTSGEPLHRRGWRVHQGRAPLSETLAAGIVLRSGWDARAPLVDPFAGSGTILIEAAWIAAGIPPGSRRGFAFERWPGHERERYRRHCAREPGAGAPARRPILLARDVDPARLDELRANAESAGVGDWIRCELGDARELELRRGWNAWIASNLPYGRRVGPGAERELVQLHRDFGARCSRLALLTGGKTLTRALALRGLERIPLINGGLAVELVLGLV